MKRATPPPVPDTNTPSLLEASHPEPAHEQAVQQETPQPHPVDDLVLTLEIPSTGVDHAAMLNIDLDLVVNDQPDEKPGQQHLQVLPSASQTTTEPLPSRETHTPVQQIAARPHEPALPAEWLKVWQAANAHIQETLDKHSQLLDTVVLNSQQHNQRPAQPEALDNLLRELLERQTLLAQQLSALEQQMHKPAEPAVVKMPDEFKLHLEKQKIELLKAFSQNIAQNTSNVDTANQQTLARIEALMAENTSATQTLEVHLAPISQSVADLKARMQAISKKVDEAAAKPVKSSPAKNDDSAEGSGGFIIFVIGLLCGLTVVLSSLAIYNFLSREPALPSKNGHESGAPADDSHDKNAHGESPHDTPAHDAGSHDEPAHTAPAHDEPAHGATNSHDKPASDSSKAKSH